MNLLANVAALLKRARYDVSALQAPRPSLYFEDDSILGIAVEFATAAELFHGWEKEQDAFLQRNALALRRAGSKSWNVYCVLLSLDGGEKEMHQAALIEENFRGARKIVGMALHNDEAITRTLLPLLPIQNDVRARSENVRELLLQRLDLPPEVKEMLSNGTSSLEIIKALSSST